jgi:hypothetical protein
MNQGLFGGALLVVAFVGAGRASTITYNVDLTSGAASVMGFIVTDGTIGTLVTANVIDWNLNLDDGISTFDLLGPLEAGTNSTVSIDGGSASASLTALTFNTSTDGENSLFVGQEVEPYAYFCAQDQDSDCLGPPPGLAWSANEDLDSPATIVTDGVTTIGTAESGTPEPSTLMMMFAALGISPLLCKRMASSKRLPTPTNC